MAAKQLWLLAGGNGAGKSTFYHTRLAPLGIPFINADILARELYPEAPEQRSYDAARLAALLRSRMLHEGRSFCFETIFSHPSKIDFVAEAKATGYEVILVFIHLDLVELNLARISQRVSEGGHDVPADKVKSPTPRTLQHIQTTLPLCDRVYLLDNSRTDNPFQQLATLHNTTATLHQNPLSEWAAELLS